jgi:hypothetical protein
MIAITTRSSINVKPRARTDVVNMTSSPQMKRIRIA